MGVFNNMLGDVEGLLYICIKFTVCSLDGLQMAPRALLATEVTTLVTFYHIKQFTCVVIT